MNRLKNNGEVRIEHLWFISDKKEFVIQKYNANSGRRR